MNVVVEVIFVDEILWDVGEPDLRVLGIVERSAEVVIAYVICDELGTFARENTDRSPLYGLPQSDSLANKLLKKRLRSHEYYQCPTTPGLWRHRWGPIVFTLIVDDFGVKYMGKHHADHLLNALRED